jgi:hypothetical protein
MTADELNNLGQMIQCLVPQGTAWILVTVPPSACTGHPDCQTVSNLSDENLAGEILDGAAGMYEHGTYREAFSRPVEKVS